MSRRYRFNMSGIIMYSTKEEAGYYSKHNMSTIYAITTVGQIIMPCVGECLCFHQLLNYGNCQTIQVDFSLMSVCILYSDPHVNSFIETYAIAYVNFNVICVECEIIIKINSNMLTSYELPAFLTLNYSIAMMKIVHHVPDR